MGDNSTVLPNSELTNPCGSDPPSYSFVNRTLILKNPLKFSSLRVPSVSYWEIYLMQSSFLSATHCLLFRAHAFASDKNIPANLAEAKKHRNVLACITRKSKG